MSMRLIVGAKVLCGGLYDQMEFNDGSIFENARAQPYGRRYGATNEQDV